MKEQVEVDLSKDTFMQWFVIAAIHNTEITEQLKRKPHVLTMQLNGVPINPQRAIERIEEQLEALIQQKASEIVESASLACVDEIECATIDFRKQLDDILAKPIKDL